MNEQAVPSVQPSIADADTVEFNTDQWPVYMLTSPLDLGRKAIRLIEGSRLLLCRNLENKPE
jgi:hypothetical protein